MSEFVFATHNARKLQEVAALVVGYGHQVQGFKGELPEEIGQTLEANARNKAAAVHAQLPDAWVLADDSGLFLDALPDQLGVHTHRQLPDPGTNAALLALFSPEMSRHCTLRSTMVLQAPSGRVQVATGILAATLALAPLGDGSRGFDRLLIPDGDGLTLAQMSTATRTPYLPRARALAQLFI